MAVFNEISDEAMHEASVVLKAVSGRGPRPEVEVMPGFEAMVAGAAIALEKGAPRMIADGVPLSTDRLVQEETPEGAMMHRAVARAIDIHRHGPDRLDEAGPVMTHIAADVHVQGRASRMGLAVSHPHAAFQEGLTSTEQGVVRYARESMAVRHDVTAQGDGAYHRLDEQAQREMHRDLRAGEVLPREVLASIASSREVVERTVEQASRSADAVERLADFQDFGRPLFVAPRAEHVERAHALAEGRTRPVTSIDQAIVAHAHASRAGRLDDLGSGFATSANERGDLDRVDAYARVMADYAGQSPTALRAAIRIESDLQAAAEARRMVAAGDRSEDTVNVAHRQRYADLDPQRQMSLHADMESGVAVPAMATVRIGHAVAAVENAEPERRRDLGSDMAREAMLRGMSEGRGV